MRALSSCASLVLMLAVAAGCQSSNRDHGGGGGGSSQSYRAEHAIQGAEAEGAEGPTSQQLRLANTSRDEARKLESDAIDDRNEANQQLRKAQDRARDADRMKADSEAKLVDFQRAREERSAEVNRLQQRRDDLASRGVEEPELQRSIDPELKYQQVFLAKQNAEIAVLEQKRTVAEYQARESDLAIKASQARMETAEQRRKLVSALYTQAECQAKAAQVERLHVKTRETRERLTGVETPGPIDTGTSTVPAETGPSVSPHVPDEPLAPAVPGEDPAGPMRVE